MPPLSTPSKNNNTQPYYYRFQILALLRTHEYAGAEDAAVQVGRIYPIAEATNAITQQVG